MISKIWNKLANRETISYVIFGILTTLVDWVTYTFCWRLGMDYRISTAVSWCTAVLFAYVTNKLFVFQSWDMSLKLLWHEFVSFVGCRAATGIFTMAAMIVMVDYAHLNEFLGKLIVSVISLAFNYVFSKLFIFKKKRSDEGKPYGS